MNDNYIFIHTKLLDSLRNNVLIEGIVESGEIKVKDFAYILGPKDNIIKTSIKSIRTLKNKLVKSASKNEKIQILLSNISRDNLSYGDIITNKKPIILSNGNYYFENTRLNGLLNYMEKFHKHGIMKYVFDELIINSHLFVIIDDLNFKLIKNNKSKFFIPVYTSLEYCKNSNHLKNNCKIQTMTFDDMKKTLFNNTFLEGFVINPCKHRITLDKNDINKLDIQRENMSNNYTTEEIDIRKDIFFEEIKEISNDFINNLVSYFINNHHINKAWILNMYYDGNKRLLLVVDVDKDTNNIFYDISNIAKPYLDTTSLDMVAYNTRDSLEFNKRAVRDIVPFYER